ncbi:MAG: DUF1501 domain-containing protein [Planctomycetota bacterium]
MAPRSKNHPAAATAGIDRRAFLRAGAASAAGITLAPHAVASGARWLDVPTPNGRNLVLVQLSGGNDGLATIVPHGDDELYRVRKTTAPRRKQLLGIDDYRGFHPNLASVRSEYDEGRVAVVEGCGYPNAVRSHFKSYEVWHTGQRAGRVSGDGWIGRLAANVWSGEDEQPDRVVHFGGKAPYSLHSSAHPAVALASPTGYRWFGDDEVYALGGEAICESEPDPYVDPRHAGRDATLAALRRTLDDARASSARVRRAAAGYRTEAEYPKSRLSAALRDVAALLSADVGTRVFSVQDRGYDTHSGQRASHDRRMGELDAALGAFVADLRRTDAGKRTVVLVFSEFGRRVKENGSKGHDHGKAGPMLLLGAPVKGGLYGEHPSLTDLDAGDLRFTTDFRSVYQTLVADWFGADAEAVLGATYPRVALV